ncbi:MAG: GumC family protein [Devosia nanyangense]|uniref:GumC family protein n=1 Tax=Devosia nanyangense TaxID=1228055 RepID=A0A933L4P8_9HYPH|nr:GumC family protein [Devosia nanyangense]
MYSTLDSDKIRQPTGLKRLARRDLPSTPRTPPQRAEQPVATAQVAGGPMSWPELTLTGALAWLRSGLKWIVVLVVVGGLAGIGYAMIAKPKFTTTTDLIIDPANLQVVTNDLYRNPLDQNAQLLDVESKLRVLTSGTVLARVVDDLKLQDDPEFGAPAGLDLPFLGGSDRAAQGDPILAATDALEKRVGAWREERSYVVTLAVSTEDPDKSVRIANAIVAAFQAELAKAESDGAGRAAAALMDRLAELRSGVAAAEDAVETFKRAHGLQQSNGELVNSQSMALLNSRAVDAQQALILAQSHYRELTDPVTGAANADAVQTPTMVALRTQYGLLKQQADANATMYGPLHPNRAAGERQLAGLAQQIAAEAARAVQQAKLELDQARGAVAGLDQQTDAARTTVATDDQALVELRELDRDARAKAAVYEAFLTRAREVTEQQQLDTTNIRTITPATPPEARSWPPRTVVVAGAGAVGGGMLGILVALGLGFLAETRRLRRA